MPRVLLACTLLLALAGCGEGDSGTGPAVFPTTAGTWEVGTWRYTHLVEEAGTRSERRIGHLFLEGDPVTGTPGEVRTTPVGTFCWFGTQGYHRGWLNTRTYGDPVFDRQGKLLPESRALLAE